MGLWHRYNNEEQRGDIAQKPASTASGLGNLMTDDGLISAAQLSLGTNRRLPDGIDPPSGVADDVMGWWGDRFWAGDFDAPDYQIGSLIWTLGRSKNRQQTLNLLGSFAVDAAEWMRRAGIIDRAEVNVYRLRQDVGCFDLALYRPDDLNPLWVPRWDVTINGI